MKAITLHGPGDVRVEAVPDPRIVVCGPDLHQYHGRVAGRSR
ncbi:MAG: hypothetical protein ACREKJ_05930 [Candidatus Rokuibacteriota bacterium]